MIAVITAGHPIYRAGSRVAPSQWETSLLSNDVSHWLGANPESALISFTLSRTARIISLLPTRTIVINNTFQEILARGVYSTLYSNYNHIDIFSGHLSVANPGRASMQDFSLYIYIIRVYIFFGYQVAMASRTPAAAKLTPITRVCYETREKSSRKIRVVNGPVDR